MNVKILMIFTLFFDVSLLQKHKGTHKSALLKILKTKSMFFYRLNYNVHVIANKLFFALKLNENVRQSSNLQKLLRVHLHFNTIAQNNYRVYEELRNASNPVLSKKRKRKLGDTILNIVKEKFDTVKDNVTNLNNAYVNASDRSYYIKNETEDSLENFSNVWSELSDKIIENILDPILEENTQNDTTAISSSILQESDTLRKLLGVLLYFNRMAQKDISFYEELKKLSDTTFRKSQKNNLQFLLHNIVKAEIDALRKNVTKLSSFYSHSSKSQNNKTLQANNNIIKFDNGISKSNQKEIEHAIDEIINEGKDPKALKRSVILENASSELDVWQLSALIEDIKVSNQTRRIYNGKSTKIKKYPFLASLHQTDEFLCAGSIIGTDLVLTAASCLQTAYKNKAYRSESRALYVRVGSAYAKRSGRRIPVTQVIIHPNFDSVTLKNNLAIVKTLKKLKHMHRRKIKRIIYDRVPNILKENIKGITILGWGSRDAKEKTPGAQRVALAHLNIYDIQDCQEVYSTYYVSETNFCAGFTFKGSGACIGDVGGPAVADEELVGVVSFGPSVCGTPDAPTVFTRVGHYAQWIDGVVNQNPDENLIEIKTKTMVTTPRVVVIPLYTTDPSVKNGQTRFSGRAKTEPVPEEVAILKQLIHDYLLGNETVIDYITNRQILEDEQEENLSGLNEKVSLDVRGYKFPENQNSFVTGSQLRTRLQHMSNVHDNRNKFATKFTMPKSILRTNPSQLEASELLDATRTTKYNGKSNPTVALIESSEKSSDDHKFSEDQGKFGFDDSSSSYYEEEIPIEDSPFQSEPRSTKIAKPYYKATDNKEMEEIIDGKPMTIILSPTLRVNELTTKILLEDETYNIHKDFVSENQIRSNKDEYHTQIYTRPRSFTRKLNILRKLTSSNSNQIRYDTVNLKHSSTIHKPIVFNIHHKVTDHDNLKSHVPVTSRISKKFKKKFNSDTEFESNTGNTGHTPALLGATISDEDLYYESAEKTVLQIHMRGADDYFDI